MGILAKALPTLHALVYGFWPLLEEMGTDLGRQGQQEMSDPPTSWDSVPDQVSQAWSRQGFFLPTFFLPTEVSCLHSLLTSVEATSTSFNGRKAQQNIQISNSNTDATL